MRRFVLLLLCGASLAYASASQAGMYTDDLGRCLVKSTSETDRQQLVRWIFMVAALHPAVREVANVSSKGRDDANRGMAALFQRLVTESCRQQAHDAALYEGAQAFEQSFGLLGQVAMRELMADPQVGLGFSSFNAYLDKRKMDAVFGAAGK